MSKVLKTVGKIAGAVALVSSVVLGPLNPVTIAATAVAAVANIGAQITAPKPVARGSANNVLIDTEPPRPYMIGESYSAGVIRHQNGYGATLNKVPNPYWWEVKVFSGVGPVDSLVQELFDFAPIGSYYTGFYSSVSQLGLRPQPAALVPPLSNTDATWTSAHKLSGCAAIGGNYLFDRDGKVYSSGRPLHGAIWRGEKVYDPRLDSTYPGGSGACRLGVETTYVYSFSPALHAGTYAYGRYEDGIRIFGIGLSADGIDWPAIVDWANDCDANGWGCHGTIYEGGAGADVQRQRIANLDDICAAGGGRWLTAGAIISFDWHRPRVSLFTITDDDILEEGGSATGVQTIRDRMNGIRPQYISPANNWEQITADEIIGTTYRTEDGQPLTQTWPLNLVKDAAQAGELASYAMADSREIGPIELNLKSRMRFYRPGEAGALNSDLLGYSGQVVITNRDLNPTTFAVPMTLKSETPGKHDFALGKVAVPPPTPVIGQTQEDRDGVTGETILVDPSIVTAIQNDFITTSSGTADNDTWQIVATVGIVGASAGVLNLNSFGRSRFSPSTATGTASFEARILLNGVEVKAIPEQAVVTGGILEATDFSELFTDTYTVPAGAVTVQLQLRRTIGDGQILTSSTRLDATVVAN